jgi:hypothetical protein
VRVPAGIHGLRRSLQSLGGYLTAIQAELVGIDDSRPEQVGFDAFEREDVDQAGTADGLVGMD